MRWTSLILLLLAAPLAAADWAAAQPVYFWPMSSALDQYLAEQVVTDGVFDVTVDPKMAKTVMTDSIDAKFLGGMDELFPLPKAETKAEDKAAEEPAGDSIEGDFTFSRPANRPVGRARGTLFLVDIRTRKVLWSTFLGDFDTRPKDLHREARNVVERLKK